MNGRFLAPQRGISSHHIFLSKPLSPTPSSPPLFTVSQKRYHTKNQFHSFQLSYKRIETLEKEESQTLIQQNSFDKTFSNLLLRPWIFFILTKKKKTNKIIINLKWSHGTRRRIASCYEFFQRRFLRLSKTYFFPTPEICYFLLSYDSHHRCELIYTETRLLLIARFNFLPSFFSFLFLKSSDGMYHDNPVPQLYHFRDFSNRYPARPSCDVITHVSSLR